MRTRSRKPAQTVFENGELVNTISFEQVKANADAN
jgi:hypothetical protein